MKLKELKELLSNISDNELEVMFCDVKVTGEVYSIDFVNITQINKTRLKESDSITTIKIVALY